MESKIKFAQFILIIITLSIISFYIGIRIRQFYQNRNQPPKENKTFNAQALDKSHIAHYPKEPPLYETGNYLPDYSSIAKSISSESDKNVFFILNISKNGCNLCLNSFFKNYKENLKQLDHQIGFAVLIFDDGQRSVGFIRGLINDMPDVKFITTKSEIPDSWQNLAHPHLTLVTASDYKIIADKELDISQKENFDMILSWITLAMKLPDTH